jgi:riboflavin kinase/FMN adenylyltransferase
VHDRPAAVAFGNFDGVHLGHQALLTAVRHAADRLGGPATVVTFDPHPLAILRPEGAPPAVDTLETRLELLRGLAIDRVVVLRFDHALAAQSADWFAREALVRRLHARHIAVGPDVRFGHGGLGRLALLQEVLAEVGGTVEPFGGVWLEGAVVSSSRVRQSVLDGDLPLAERLLGRPFCLRGPVIHGDARGRSIGFPTANLEVPGQVLPALGVYATLLRIDGELLPAVTNIGMRPTFAGTRVQVEAHVLDWQEDLYGRNVELHVLERLRGEQRFAGIDALKAQIALDIDHARLAITGWQGQGVVP